MLKTSFAIATLRASPEPPENASEPPRLPARRERFQHSADRDRNIIVAAIVLRGLDQVMSRERQIALERMEDQPRQRLIILFLSLLQITITFTKIQSQISIYVLKFDYFATNIKFYK